VTASVLSTLDSHANAQGREYDPDLRHMDSGIHADSEIPFSGTELTEIPSSSYWRLYKAINIIEKRYGVQAYHSEENFAGVDMTVTHCGKFMMIDPESQVLILAQRFEEGLHIIGAWNVSTGKKGLGFVPDSGQTPTGSFKVGNTIEGIGEPIGTIYHKNSWGHRAAPSLATSQGTAYMTSRLLYIDGCDKKNRNTLDRSIVIHGTNREQNLGTADSGGCIRIDNAAVIALSAHIQQHLADGFDQMYLEIVHPDDPRYAVPANYQGHVHSLLST